MKILFEIDEQVHFFKVTGTVTSEDLKVIRESLGRFFGSLPQYTVLDLSEINSEATDDELQNLAQELRILTSSKGLFLSIAFTDIESRLARQQVLEAALYKQIEVLRARLEIREEMSRNLESLIEMNQNLKQNLKEKAQTSQSLPKGNSALRPLIDRLWSDR